MTSELQIVFSVFLNLLIYHAQQLGSQERCEFTKSQKSICSKQSVRVSTNCDTANNVAVLTGYGHVLSWQYSDHFITKTTWCCFGLWHSTATVDWLLNQTPLTHQDLLSSYKCIKLAEFFYSKITAIKNDISSLNTGKDILPTHPL